MKRWILTILMGFCFALVIAPGLAFASPGDWTYDASDETLTYVDDSSIVLNNVTVDSDNSNCLSIGCNLSKEFTSLDLSGSVTDKEGNAFIIAGIGDNAFTYCHSLKSVVIPGSVKCIGYAAFCGCINLSKIEIHDGVKSIGNNAFTDCRSLESITIPGSVEYIGYAAFCYDHSLKTVTVFAMDPPKLDQDAFFECPTIIEVPHSKELIEAYKNSWSQYGDKVVGIADHYLAKTEAKDPTCTEDGNKEYWICKWCDECFSDAEGQEYIDPAETVISATGHDWGNDGYCTVCGSINPDFTPSIISGIKTTWHKGSGAVLTFISNAAFDDFQKVQVDNIDVNPSNYTVKRGSTIVTLNASYLDSLSVGEHTLSIVFDTGIATTEFVVSAAEEQGIEGQAASNTVLDDDSKQLLPKTSDGLMLPIGLFFVLVLVSVVVGIIAYRKLHLQLKLHARVDDVLRSVRHG